MTGSGQEHFSPSAVPPAGGGVRVGVIGSVGGDRFAENILDCLPAIGVLPVQLGAAAPRPADRRIAGPLRVARLATDRIDLAYQRRIVTAAERADVTTVICVTPVLHPATVRELRRRGIPACLWFPDPVSNLGRARMLLGDYDALFFKDPLLARRLADMLGLPASYLPEACNPARHRPPGDGTAPGDQPHVVFVGTMYSERARLIEQLLDHGVSVRIYGPPIPRWLWSRRLAACHAGRYVASEEKAAVFRGALAVINALRSSEMQSVNCRLFEATASGGMVLCERREVLPDLFAEEREILAFSTFNELIAQIKRCSDDPAAAREMGDAASLRSLRDHTYQRRLTKLLEVML